MCGICGIVDFSADPPARDVEYMTESLRHRGPDAGGTCSFLSCRLGHRRLSILDLSEAANQPMMSHDLTTALVFNGEIYNFHEIRDDLQYKGHLFRTSSDTEVLLALYREKKEEMFADLNGMFSLAIWDDRANRLILSRDRVGKKPLYYWRQGSRLSFASELTSLLHDSSVPKELWNQALFEYFLYDFVPGDHTIFKGVHKLPPATFAVFDASGFRIHSYWKPPEPDSAIDYRETEERLEELLEDSTRLRLISDVPLGAFLSGGIDSSLITALMCRHSTEKVKTFSISFPGTSHDESSWARMAATHLDTEHREYPVDYDVQEIVPALIRHFGEPFGDSSAIPTWHLAEQTRRHVTVALSGDGGDELFGGYDRYLARRFQVIYDLIPARLRDRIIEPIIGAFPESTDYYGTSVVKKLKLFVRAAKRVRENPEAVIPRTFSLDEVHRLTGLTYESDPDPVLSAARQWMGVDPVSRMLLTDIQTYMAEDILTKVDRMSMAHSLEVRSPLLDYRVVELACRMPLGFKMHGTKTKRILKDVAASLIPSAILKRSKYGFQVPLGAWFKGELKAWTEERLLDPPHDLFHKDCVETLWRQHQAGQADHAHRIWLLVVFNQWYHEIF